MATPTRVEKRGSILHVLNDDGSVSLAYQVPGGAWVIRDAGTTPAPDPDPDPDPSPTPGEITIYRRDGMAVKVSGDRMTYSVIIVNEAKKLGLSDTAARNAAICGLMTALVESVLLMLANSNVPESLGYPHDGVGSDHESLGLMQQQTVWGWGSTAELMNAEYNAAAFYGGATGPNAGNPPGLLDFTNWESKPKGVACQDVQVSEFPDRYNDWEAGATELYDHIAAGGGGTPGDGRWQWPFNPVPYTDGGDMPAPGSQDAVWAEYGPRSGIGVGGFHEGIDAGYGTMLNGADIRCAGDGVVYDAAMSGGYGNRIRVDHPDGTSTSYCHIQNGGMLVGPGAQVTAGQHIGVVGGTGGVAPHLHFETHETTAANQVPNTANNGGYRSAINPRDYMGARV